MFTGIIEEIGKVENIKKGVISSIITIKVKKVLQGTNIGDSIAVNGVCLTVVRIADNIFDADVMAETIRHSNLSKIQKGDFVNLERAMSANGRFGGHIVSGHIDNIGTIVNLKREDNAVWVEIKCEEDLLKYIVYKGSVALDGVSLTVANVTNETFAVSLIPHTRQETTLYNKGVGSEINIECDIIGKYIEKMLLFDKNENNAKSKINIDFLSQNGFI